jgi:hypothetical protein
MLDPAAGIGGSPAEMAAGLQPPIPPGPLSRFVKSSAAAYLAPKRMTDRGWGRPFDEPIKVDGRTLATLRDAGRYIAGLPKAVHDRTEWQAAAEALLLVVERGGTGGYEHR